MVVFGCFPSIDFIFGGIAEGQIGTQHAFAFWLNDRPLKSDIDTISIRHKDNNLYLSGTKTLIFVKVPV